jgi:integrase
LWRHDALVALREGRLHSAGGVTLREAADAWLAGAREGTIRTRSGDRYKPSAIRGYEASLRLRILPELGDRRMSELRRGHIQDVVDELVADLLAPATIQATIIPLKAICRREVHRGRLAVNPTAGIELPAVRGGRDRIADPVEAAGLLTALPEADRAIWATAMYAGLRRGELMALRAESIDLDANVIHVERGGDAKGGDRDEGSQPAPRPDPCGVARVSSRSPAPYGAP